MTPAPSAPTVPVVSRLLSVNHTPGRPRPIDMVVIHVTEGPAASVRSWFAAKVAQVSAHYMVTADGVIDQFVREEDQAWHAGRVDHPTAPLVLARPHVNPNQYSIGIEHEGSGHSPMTPRQEAASLALIRDLCQRYQLPIDRTHIVGHHEVYSLKTCPGAIDVDALVAKAAASAAAPAEPLVVWSDYLGEYLVVTRVVSDTDWWFLRASDLPRSPAMHSTTSLSAMPRKKVA